MKENNGFKTLIVIIAVVLTILGVVPQSALYDSFDGYEYENYDYEYYENYEQITILEAQESIKEQWEAPAYTVQEQSALLYVQTDSNVRSGPSTDYDVIGWCGVNQKINVTGVTDNGWYRIQYGNEVGYIASGLVSTAMVATPQPVQPQQTQSQPQSESQTQEPQDPKERWEYSEAELIQLCLSECITSDMNEVEKAIAIHDYLCNIMTYDYTYTHVSTFDALAYGTGVCQGYANAYKKLMDGAGIPTDYVSGVVWNGKEWVRHAWNRSLIGGYYFYTDVCWDDTMGGNYFLLISYEEISKSRVEQEINRENRVK